MDDVARRLLFATAIFTVISAPAAAQDEPIANFLASRPALGYGAATVVSRSLPSTEWNGSETEWQHFNALEKGKVESYLGQYRAERLAITYVQNGYRVLRAASDGLADVSAISGVQTAMMVKAGLATADVAMDSMLKRQTENAYAILGGSINAYMQANGFDLEELEQKFSNDPHGLLEELRSVRSPIDPLDMSGTEGWEPEEKAIYTQAVARGLNLQVRALVDVAVENERSVEDLRQETLELARVQSRFVEEATAQFQEIASDIQSINTRVGAIEQRVDQLGAENAIQNGDIAFLQDFMFSRMTPEEQQQALELGMIGRHLSAEQREQLREKIDIAVERKKLMDKIGGYVNGANQVLSIANDLGVSVPEEVTEAAAIGTAAFEAFSAFSGGNYLAAVGMMTGALSNKPDIGTQRHEQLVGMLTQVLGGIEELKQGQQEILNQIRALQEGQRAILETQQIIYQSVVDLARAVEANHADVMTRLDFLGREIFSARVFLSGQAWADVQHCKGALEELSESPLLARSVADLEYDGFIAWQRENAVDINLCLAGLSERIVNPVQWQWFSDSRAVP